MEPVSLLYCRTSYIPLPSHIKRFAHSGCIDYKKFAQFLHTAFTCKQNVENVIHYVLGCFAFEIHSTIDIVAFLASIVTKVEAICYVSLRDSAQQGSVFMARLWNMHTSSTATCWHPLYCIGRAGTDARRYVVWDPGLRHREANVIRFHNVAVRQEL